MFIAFMNRLKDLLGIAIDNMARQAEADFTCGDCDRNAQCGRTPDSLCIARAAQIARGQPPKHPRWPRPVS